tara:strand:- start:29833 stop:30840 length:1008 start_codon:yes stop_codon:yes gene_type:complete
MQTITVRNVHEALPRGLDYLDQSGVLLDSRNGMMYEAPCPVTTVYKKPDERVVFWSHRNANPFFHFMEGLWMLHGRNDLETVEWYAKSMRNYSDDGRILWGAYGWRWRKFFNTDQLDTIVAMLRKNPEDRRAVLQMWAIQDLGRNGKDVPCNTCIYFKIRNNKLNMTVSNRSNDVIWGAYGANAVHMSMLQEYMASRIGVDIGVYYQVSDSYHAYKDIFDDLLQKFAEDDILDYYVQSLPHSMRRMNPYRSGEVSAYPMMSSRSKYTWDLELKLFFRNKPLDRKCDKFWQEVAIPIRDSWMAYKGGSSKEGIKILDNCQASDWRKACVEWLERKL